MASALRFAPSSSTGGSALAAAAGILLDGRFGEPPLRPHPLVVFGRVMRASEARLWRDHRLAGSAHAAIGIGFGLVAGRLARSATLATYVAVAGRALDDAAAEVAGALAADDLDAARLALPALVGRDPSELGPSDIARAVVESLAENTVDAVVAPACWAAVAGAPGALGYRAVNTLDAMVGHRSTRYQRFGWASARLDDVANLVPARLTALLVVAVRPSAAGAVWRAVRDDAPAHPSPNSGVAEAAFAAALGLQLGGPSRYGDRVEQRPALGTGRPAEPGDIAAARRLARDVAHATAAFLAVAGTAASLVGRNRPRPASTLTRWRRIDVDPAPAPTGTDSTPDVGGTGTGHVGGSAVLGGGGPVPVPVPRAGVRVAPSWRVGDGSGRVAVRRARPRAGLLSLGVRP